MTTLRIPLPKMLRHALRRRFISIPLARCLPLVGILLFGVLFGLVFSSGLDHPYDKVLHLCFYAALTLALRHLMRCRIWYAAAIAFVIGLGGEAAQSLLPNHDASLEDALANGVGVLFAAIGTLLYRSEVRQSLREGPLSQSSQDELDWLCEDIDDPEVGSQSGSSKPSSGLSVVRK